MALLLLLVSFPSAAAVKKKASDPETVLKQGREAFLNYDFEKAADLYEQYQTLKKKSKKPLDEDFEKWEQELEIANNAFERVQKIEIIDSLSFPFDSFYKAYKLAASAGKIDKINEFKSLPLADEEVVTFINEDGDLIFWSIENEDGNSRIMEAKGLLDGDWIVEESLEGDFDKNGDYLYPFLSQDGQTLYFASDGEGSMGGLDIFVAQRDPFSNEYRQPLNIGMPFNSPANDFMMAIDEENGLGWWATDRNSVDGEVTVYVYILEEVRKNYPIDTEDLDQLAKISEYKATQNPEREKIYNEYSNKIQ